MRFWFTGLFFYGILLAGKGWSQDLAEKKSPLYDKASLAFEMVFRNTDSAMLLAGEVLQDAEKNDDKPAIANAYNSIGWAFMQKGHLDSSIFFLEKAHVLFSSLKSELNITRVALNMAEVYTRQYKIKEATRYLIEADSLSAKIKSIAMQTDVKRQWGIIYRESGDDVKAARYFEETLAGFIKLQDYNRYVNTAISVSILYRKMNLYDSSLYILKECMAIAKEKSGTPYQMAMIEEHMAESYLGTKKYNDALAHYTIAYNRFQKLNNSADIAYEAFNVGKTLSKLKRYNEAQSYLLKAWMLSDSLKMLNYQVDISYELSDAYAKSGNMTAAYEYLKKYSVLLDTINVAEQLEKTNELKEKFEAEKNEQKIALLTTQNHLSTISNRKSKLLQYIFILLFVMSVVMTALLLSRGKIRRKLQEQLLRNRLAGDLHDDIGSALSSIDISSRIAMIKKDDAAAVETQLQKIRQQARNSMESMSDIVWSISADNDSFESTLTRMKEFAAEVCEPLEISLDFELPEELQQVSISPDKRKNLFLVFKEAVNNAVKYSGCKSLLVKFKKSGEGDLSMTIQDDGNGFDIQNYKPGNGLKNMKARAEQSGATFSIHSEKGKGTAVALTIPAF